MSWKKGERQLLGVDSRSPDYDHLKSGVINILIDIVCVIE